MKKKSDGNDTSENRIDFVIPWVDGSDPAWRAEKRKYTPEAHTDDDDSRYRDWELLQYWFRGAEKFAPWVGHIWFVTWGHVPSWLKVDHPKLTVVRHEDYIPREYLPTFSSHPIEMNFHRIQGLSEQFVYFNDDMFLTEPVEKTDFFVDGLPRDCCIETAVASDNIDDPFGHILLNNAAVVNMHYRKKVVIRKNWKKWFSPAYGSQLFRNVLMLPYQEFSGFKYSHVPSAFLKSSYEKLWADEGERLDRLCRNRFRSAFDVNQYLVSHWQCMEGNFVPRSPKIGAFCLMGRDDGRLTQMIKDKNTKMLCINDDSRLRDFEAARTKVWQAFESILPEKSSFEK